MCNSSRYKSDLLSLALIRNVQILNGLSGCSRPTASLARHRDPLLRFRKIISMTGASTNRHQAEVILNASYWEEKETAEGSRKAARKLRYPKKS